MTASAAKKRRVLEPDEQAQESTNDPAGLWIDESALPTNLAKRGSSKQGSVIEFPSANAESRPIDRILRLADIVFSNPKGLPAIDRRKKQKKFKGVERRSARQGRTFPR